MTAPLPHPLRRRPLLAAAFLLLLLLLAACGDGDSPPTPSPASPTFSPPGLDEGTVTPTPLPPETSYRFVYREFGQEQDTIWKVVPSDPSQRESIAVIPHRPDWGVIPSLSPDATRIAYLTYPPTATDPAFQSQAFLLDLETGETSFLAKAVDLAFPPLWSPDGELLYLRRSFFVGQEVMILQVDLREPVEGATPSATPTLGPDDDPLNVHTILRDKVSRVLTFIPVGFAGDERSMFFVQVQGGTGGGTLLGSFAPATAEAVTEAIAIAEQTATALAEAAATALARATASPGGSPAATRTPTPTPTRTPEVSLVVQLSEQIGRDFDLSPGATKLTFLEQQLVEGQFLFRTLVADLVSRSVAPLPTEGLGAADHLVPLWHPDGKRISVGLAATLSGPGSVALVPLGGGAPSFLPAPEAGFDLPLSWAPDGSYLAVTSFRGDSLANPGRARLVLVAPTGHRLDVADGADVEVLGWVKEEG